MSQHARQEEGKVALDHNQDKYGVKAELLDQMRKKLKAGHTGTVSSKQQAVGSIRLEITGCY
jgi:hypothetical protein